MVPSGPLFFRRWFSREPHDEEFVRRVVERAIGAPIQRP
jgi:hypothetical protein